MHRLAEARRRAALAIAILNGTRIRALREFGCAGMVGFGACGGFLPWCAGSVVDAGGYELVDCCFCGGGAFQWGVFCDLGEEAVCWAGGVCEEVGLTMLRCVRALQVPLGCDEYSKSS